MIARHESIEHRQPRRDGVRPVGRDSAQLRGPLRSSVARGAAGGAGGALPPDGGNVGRFSAERGVLGSSLRARWLRGFERWGALGEARALEPSESRSGGEGPSRLSFRLRTRGPALGWPTTVGLPETATGRDPSGEAVPTIVPSDGLPIAQTQTPGSLRRSAVTGGTQKNSGNSPLILPSICGRWMRSTSSSTAAVVGCGCPQRCMTRSAAMRRPAKVSATLGPCGYETASSATPSPADDLTPKPAGRSSATCVASAGGQADGSSSSRTTPGTTTPPCTPNGGNGRNRLFVSILSRRTVRNSIRSSVSGNCSAACGCITATSPRFPNSQRPSMRSSRSGPDPTRFPNGSVRSTKMRKHLGCCV